MIRRNTHNSCMKTCVELTQSSFWTLNIDFEQQTEFRSTRPCIGAKKSCATPPETFEILRPRRPKGGPLDELITPARQNPKQSKHRNWPCAHRPKHYELWDTGGPRGDPWTSWHCQIAKTRDSGKSPPYSIVMMCRSEGFDGNCQIIPMYSSERFEGNCPQPGHCVPGVVGVRLKDRRKRSNPPASLAPRANV